MNPPFAEIESKLAGAQNVIDAALKTNVSNVVALSTDKAVMPINSMGMTKALMEKILLSKARNAKHKTIFSIVRYGNVIYSRGSVLPLFVNQILSNKKITITDPNMTRFLMSLDDAVELVLFAFEHGDSGDLFVNKAPAGTIGDLAQALKELCDKDNKIKIIGTRHGEKLFETLCTREEMIKAEDMGEFYRIPADNRDLNYSQYFSEGTDKLSNIEDYNSHNTHRKDIEGMKKLLSQLPLIKKEVFGKNQL